MKNTDKKTTRLKQLLTSPQLTFLMEAHSGISAKIAEEAGFEGIWGSGLSISAALGVRDNNEASWTQVLEVVEFMSDATTIPILLDGDTGYGNFNNMRRLVKKLEQRGIGGVCIEDKIFPKTNSFLRGEAQPLADMEEFCGKIKAGLDARSDDDFCIVARVEALIAGHGMKEALKRARAYAEAGATAILMHSKKSTAEEIFTFMKEWNHHCPVVIVPTKYYATPTEEFRQHKISTVIWANHLMRSSVQAMQATAAEIFQQKSLMSVEDKVVPVMELFRLQNDDELAEAEKKYFASVQNSAAIVMAASRGKELGELTLDKPKTLLMVNGKTILKDIVEKLSSKGVSDIVVVRGYKKDVFPKMNCRYVDNDQYEQTAELSSLYLAKEAIQGEVIFTYGDILFRKFALDLLHENSHDISILVDSRLSERRDDYVGDFVSCSSPNHIVSISHDALLLKTHLGPKKDCLFTPQGEWTGLMRSSSQGSAMILKALNELYQKSNFSQLKMGDLLNYLIEKNCKIGVVYIEGHWLDIDNFKDYENIQIF